MRDYAAIREELKRTRFVPKSPEFAEHARVATILIPHMVDMLSDEALEYFLTALEKDALDA